MTGNDADRVAFNKKLEAKISIVKQSAFFKELTTAVTEEKVLVRQIRCLALGSITSEGAALYQYACLCLIADLLNVDRVSLWDPAFNDEDAAVIEDKNYIIEERFKRETGGEGVLYYMPHIPIEVLERVLPDEKPQYMITNNVSVYGDKWTDSQLYVKFKNVALLKNSCYDLQRTQHTILHDKQNGFEIAKPKKNRKNRKSHQETKVDYDYSNCHYQHCKEIQLETSKDLTQVYGTAFSDLALYITN